MTSASMWSNLSHTRGEKSWASSHLMILLMVAFSPGDRIDHTGRANGNVRSDLAPQLPVCKTLDCLIHAKLGFKNDLATPTSKGGKRGRRTRFTIDSSPAGVIQNQWSMNRTRPEVLSKAEMELPCFPLSAFK